MTEDKLKDSESRRRIREDLDHSLLVEAAAGTGKTSELVRRIVAILREGRAETDEIVAVTFTRKAAGELKLRVRERLDRARNLVGHANELDNLERAIARLEEAHIGTIHSFCAELLRERPVEANVDPDFEELAEDELPQLFDQAFRPWIESRLSDPPLGIRRVLSRSMISDWGRSSPLEQLKSAALKFLDWRDYGASWEKRPFERKREIDQLIEMSSTLASMSANASDRSDELYRSLRPVRDFQSWVEKSDKEHSRNYEILEGFLLQLARELSTGLNRRMGRGKFSAEFTRVEVLGFRESFLETLEGFQTRAGADLACLLQAELEDLLASYEAHKTRTGKLDFTDLLLKARDVVRSNREIRAYFQSRFSHIFVDEFQDTDPLQAELLLLLSSDSPEIDDWNEVTPISGKLFLVGDPKQSIYRFRRADVILYEEIKERLTSRGVDLVHLNQSFRSLAPIQELVNAAFGPEMQGRRERGEPDYISLDEFRQPEDDRPSVVVLPAPHPYGIRNISNLAIAESQSEAIAAFVNWLLRESDWKISNPEAPEKQVQVEPQNVAILFRRFVSWGSDVTKPYARALEARGLPHVLVGSRSFHEREEVETVRAALVAIEYPDDELALYATLRGSLFSLPDALLFRFKSDLGVLSPFLKNSGEHAQEYRQVFEALSFLRQLHCKRNQQPFVRTIHELMRFTRFHAALALRPAGHQVLANVQRICDLARNFELAGTVSFRSFVEYLENEAANPSGGQGPVVEEGVEGIRLMTVHRAKGLEFPVVILADMTCGLKATRPDRYIDSTRDLAALSVLGCRPWELLENEKLESARDSAEGIRIAYVAATRARDLLVVPAVGDEEREGWISPLNKAIYPPRKEWRDAKTSPFCPAIGTTSVLSRPVEYDGKSEFSVRPGLHHPQAGRGTILWWDPALLTLKVEGDFGLRSKQLLNLPDDEAEIPGIRDFRDWEKSREEALNAGKRKSTVPLTVTGSKDIEAPPERGPIQIERVGQMDKGGPGGTRFGTLVHAILRDMAFDATERQVTEQARILAQAGDVPGSEVKAAVRSVVSVLNHFLIRRASASRESYREFPFLLKMEKGRLLEGSIDLAFLEDDTFHIVDFKTDKASERKLEGYLKQVGWYMEAVHQLNGRKVQGWILLI